MARGQAQAADTNLKTTNAIGGQELNKRNQLEGQLIPGYTSLMDTGYLSPEEEAAARTSEMGAAIQPFESAKFEGANRAARTGNAAGLAGEDESLALEEGRAAGGAAAGLQKQKMSNQLEGMQGMGELSNEDLQMAEKMYGLGPETLRARAAGPSGAQDFESYMKGIGALMPGH